MCNPAAILEALIALEERGLSVAACRDVPSQSRRRLVYGRQFTDLGRIELLYESNNAERREWCYVPLARSDIQKIRNASRATSKFPTTVFGIGYADYLEDTVRGTYFRLKLDRFYFPIPKM